MAPYVTSREIARTTAFRPTRYAHGSDAVGFPACALGGGRCCSTPMTSIERFANVVVQASHIGNPANDRMWFLASTRHEY